MSSQGRPPNRRTFLQAAAGAGAFIATGAHAEDSPDKWPERLVRIIVPYPPGGSTDVLTRILADRLKDTFNQSIIVENRPGAGGNIGIAAVTGSKIGRAHV